MISSILKYKNGFTNDFTHFLSRIAAGVSVFLFLCLVGDLFGQTTSTYTSSGTWICPYGVTTIQVEAWGAGGAGGNGGGSNSQAGGGGGGGGYSKNVSVAVTAGTSYTITIGAGGLANTTTVGANGSVGGQTTATFGATTISANGGAAGIGYTAGSAGGAGGTGDNYSGGAGGAGDSGTGRAGGGGEGAGTTATGGNATGGTGGSGTDGGNGATSAGASTSSSGVDATLTGGGGSGSVKNFIAGDGYKGQMILTYTLPTFSGTYSVGPSGTFSTITTAISNIEVNGISGAVIFELQADYTDASETYPITLSSITGASSTNTVTYRPVSGATSRVSDGDPGSTNALFLFSGADYIIFDGRAGGSGSTQWTIKNTNANATASNRGSTFKFISDASNNVLKYLTIEGDAYYSSGIINFSTATTTGNDNNTVSYCKIQNYSNTTYIPGTAVYSLGTSAKTNSGNIVEYCEIVDVFGADQGSSGNITLSTYNTAWTIRYNDFYKNSATTFGTNSSGHNFIRITDGGTYSIQGNDMGGTEINTGGGTKYTVTGTSRFLAIYFVGSAASETNTIYSNNISNIAYTSTYTSAVFIFSGIRIEGSGDFLIGNTASETNTIGSTSIANDIAITNNAASGSLGICAIYFMSTGTASSIKYNNIGGLTLNGSRSDASTYMIKIDDGTVTIDNNTIGNSVANNILISSDANFYGIYNGSANGSIATNNTIRNIDDNSTASTFYGIYNASGSLTCTSNTISNITSANAGANNYTIIHTGSTATISSNTVHTISVENASASNFVGIFINTASVVTANSNTIGSTTDNNISFAGNGPAHGIYNTGSGSRTFDSNTIQEFNLSNTGTSTFFYAIRNYSTGGILTSASSNVIREVDCSGTVSGVILCGIMQEYNNTSGSNSLENNTISNLNSLTTSAIALEVEGLYCATGIGTIKRNKVSGLTVKSTSTSSGIVIYANTAGTWSGHNNVGLVDNGTNTNDIYIYGVYNASTGNSNYYHNTIKLYGTVANATKKTYCYYRSGSGTDNVKNNIFQNVRSRTAGTAGQYAEYYSSTAGTLTTNNNYLEVSADVNKLGYWAADKTFAAFVTASGAALSLNGTNTISAEGSAAADFTGANLGVDLFTGSTVTVDKNNAARDNLPWMGAFEGVFALPIQLISFVGKKDGKNNELKWTTGSEINNDFFTIEKTIDGIDFEVVGIENGAGNSSQYIDYSLIDYNVRNVINYYRLKQTDFDGKYDFSELIAIDNSSNEGEKEIVLVTNILGQEVNEYYRGIVIIVYADGTSLKVIQ